MPGYPHWPLSLRFFHQNLVHASPRPIRATCPAHPISILSRAKYWVRNRDHEVLHYVVFSPLLGPNVLLNTLYLNTPRLSVNVSDQVSRQFIINVYKMRHLWLRICTYVCVYVFYLVMCEDYVLPNPQ
jgi:hypothetical protein